MALPYPAQITVASAGTAAVNGAYTKNGSNDAGGFPIWTGPNGFFIYWLGTSSTWNLGTVPAGNNTQGIYQNGNNAAGQATLANGPMPAGFNNWTSITGTAPAPTLTDTSPVVPTAPAAPTVSNLTQTSAQVAIPALAGNATSYNLQRAQDSAGVPGAYTAIATGVTPSATYGDNTLLPSTGYYYLLVAVNTAGTTTGAATAKITTPAIVRTSAGARASNLQSVYYSPELPTAPGTIVLPAKRLPNFELQTKPTIPNKGVKYAGSKATTAMQLGQEESTSTYNAAADYNLLALILSGVLGTATSVVALGGGAYQWTWNVSPTQPMPVPSTLSMDNGSARGGERFGYGVFSGTAFKWSQQDAGLSGSMFGQGVIRDIGPQMLVATNPAGVSEIPIAAIMPKSVGAWLSLDGGNTFNRMQKDLDGELRINNMWAPVYHINDLNASYDDVREEMPDMGLTLTVEEGTEADTFMSRLYAGQSVYAGCKTVGPVIGAVGGTNVNYMLKANLPCFVSAPDPGDKSGVFGNTFKFDVAHDNTFGLIQVQLINKMASL